MEKHPSILAIASECKNRANFSFNFVSKENVLTEIKVLDVSKAIQKGDVPVKIIKTNDNFFAEAISFYSNKSLENGKFRNCLKLANITPAFKRGARASKTNRRFSKIFEMLLSRQLLEFFDNILSKFRCGFRKGYGTQHCLLLMLGIWKGATDNNKAFGPSIIDLSKAFNCLSHDLLIAKVHAYGLDIDSLNILRGASKST